MSNAKLSAVLLLADFMVHQSSEGLCSLFVSMPTGSSWTASLSSSIIPLEVFGSLRAQLLIEGPSGLLTSSFGRSGRERLREKLTKSGGSPECYGEEEKVGLLGGNSIDRIGNLRLLTISYKHRP